MTPEEIAWAAGLFEGEGCISTTDTRVGIRLQVVMCDRDVVERFYRLVGVGTFNQVQRQPSWPAHHRDKWKWYCGSYQETRELLNLLVPWLGERRRARALELLAQIDEAFRERDCAFCGQPFIPDSAKQDRRFCSKTCCASWFNRDRQVRGKPTPGQLSLTGAA